MAENTEAQLLQRFNVLIGAVVPLGADYNPPNSFAAVSKLQLKAAAGQAAIDALDTKESEEASVRNARQTLFAPIAALGSDLYQYCKAAGWAENDLADLQSNVRKLRGGRAVPKPEDDPTTPDVDESDTGGSASQRSFASMEGNWSEIITFLTEKGYSSSETGMQPADLIAKRDEMRAANLAVAVVEGEIADMRQTRDEVFYTDADSIVKSAGFAKSYLRAVHDDTQAWVAVKDLDFQPPRRLT